MKLFFQSIVFLSVLFLTLGAFAPSIAATTPYCRVTLNSNATQIKYGGDGPAGSTVRLWALNKASSPIDRTKVSPYLSSYDSGTWHAAKIAQCSLSGNGSCSQDFFNFSLPSGTYDMYCDVQGPSATLCSGDGFPGQATNTASCQGAPLTDGTNPGPISRNFSSSGSNAGSAVPNVSYCSVTVDNKDESNPSYNEITLSYKGKGGTVTLYIDQKGTPLPGTDFGLRGFFSPNYGQAYSPQDQAQIVGKPTTVDTGHYIFGKYSDGNENPWFTSNVVTKIRNVDDNIGQGPDVIVGVYKYIRGFSAAPSGFDANASDNVFHYTPAQCNGMTGECRESGLKMRFPKNTRAWVFCGVRYSIDKVVDKLQCIGNPVCAYNGGPQSNPTPPTVACGAWKQSCDLAAQKNPAGVPPVQHTDFASYDPANLCVPGSTCKDGSICKTDGTCGGPCDDSTNKCSGNKACNTTTGKCEDACSPVGSVCSNGQICQANGKCAPCTSGSQCAAGQQCSTTGICGGADTCGSNENTCQQWVIDDTHTCKLQNLADGSACTDRGVKGSCETGICRGVCSSDADCTDGQKCDKPAGSETGICRNSCDNDSQCSAGQLCVQNFCHNPTDTNFDLDLILTGVGTGSFLNNSPKNPTREVLIELFDSESGSTTPVSSGKGNVTYDPASGTFKGKNIPLYVPVPVSLQKNLFTVKVKTDRYLRKTVTKSQVNFGGNFLLPKTALLVGDIVKDNEVNILDYNVLADCGYGAINPLPMTDEKSPFNSQACKNHPERAMADLNDNGVVDAIDYNYLLPNLANRYGE